MEPGILARVALYTLALLACALLGGYAFARGDGRTARLALVSCLLGILTVLLARTLQLVTTAEAQSRLLSAVAVVGLVISAAGGGWYTIHLSRTPEPSRSGWAGFAVALGVTLALQPVLNLGAVDRVVPASPALAVLVLLAWMVARRRHLFPGLDRMVLETSVPESGGGIVVFGADGAYIDTGAGEAAVSLSLEGSRTLEAFLTRVREKLVSGSFFTLDEMRALDRDEPGREIELRVPGGTAHYLVFANAVRGAQGSRLGVVFGFFDISLEKRLAAELDASNADLDQKNTQLRGYLAVAGQLQEERERRMVADEVHRTLWRKIEGLLASARGGQDAPPAGLAELLAGCRGVMGEIRSTVRRLDPGPGHAEAAP